jgi:hypothetical protein
MKFTTTSTSILLLAMVSTMSGKAVEARVGGGREGRNLNTNHHNCVGDGGYTWCATKSKCLRPFEEDCPTEPVTEPVDGGDVDVYGCRASAGYTWCESKGSCIRSFDEDCPTDPGPQCGRRCTTTYDCSSIAGIWDTGHAWCGAECSDGRCHPKYHDCNSNSDCDQTKAVCGQQGYCVGK